VAVEPVDLVGLQLLDGPVAKHGYNMVLHDLAIAVEGARFDPWLGHRKPALMYPSGERSVAAEGVPVRVKVGDDPRLS
jgi:hypothetical protein